MPSAGRQKYPSNSHRSGVIVRRIMNQINLPPGLTQDEIRVHAWAQVREPSELQLALLGRRALVSIAAQPGEAAWTQAAAAARLRWIFARAVAQTVQLCESICRLGSWPSRGAPPKDASKFGSCKQMHRFTRSNRPPLMP